MARVPQAQRDLKRRERVERHHQLMDATEDFEAAKAATTDLPERRRLDREFAAYRQEHRQRDVELGILPQGASVQLQHVMWARWITIASDHQLLAADAMNRVEGGYRDALLDELHHSLVSVVASGSAVEALYEDVRFLIPEPRLKKNATASERFVAVFDSAFGGLGDDDLANRIEWLAELRNSAVHPFSESGSPVAHPAGLLTHAENARFNGVESRRALSAALDVLRLAERPSAKSCRWVIRWASERRTYHEMEVGPIRARLADEGAD